MERQLEPDALSKLAPLFLPKAQRKQRLFEEKMTEEGKLKKPEAQKTDHAELSAGPDIKKTEKGLQEVVVKSERQDKSERKESQDGNLMPDRSKKRKVGRPKKAQEKGLGEDIETVGLHLSVPGPLEEGATFGKAESALLTNNLHQGDNEQIKVDETASKKVPDIFLTTNERKQRQLAAKREEARVQEERAAAVEQAKLEKLRVKEERKKEAEERKLKAKEEKAKAAEEKKIGTKAEKESAKRGVEEGTPEKKKRGRPAKVKESETELIQTSENEGGVQQGPSLLEKMRKRQEDFKESIRESQEAHAKLHAGKATHPFFMRKQGLPAADGAAADVEPPLAKEAKPSLEPLCPMHVTQAKEEETLSVQWSERQLSSTEASTSEHSLEPPSSVSLLDLSSPTIEDERPIHAASSLQKIQKNGLQALFDFVQSRGSSSELDSLDALEQRFEQYKARAAVQKAHEELPLNLSFEVGGESAPNALWCFKYEPLSSNEVCGNQSSVAFIRDWLSEWTDKIAREQQKKLLTSAKPSTMMRKPDTWQASEESSEWLVSGGVSDSELGDEEGGPPNVLLLSGPTGVGKTAAVYALAKELGYQVLESNPSERRSRALVLQRFGEATESKGLLKWSLKGRNHPEKKTGTAKGALARFYGQQNGSPEKKGGPAPKQVRGPSKRSTLKRRQKSRLSESEISAFQESISIDSATPNKKARSIRKRGKQVEVNEGEDQGIEQIADGRKGEKRSVKRRKKVGFDISPGTKEESLSNAPATKELSERVRQEGNACEEVRIEAEDTALKSEEKPELEGGALSTANGIEDRSDGEKPAENESRGFEPVYQRRKSNSRNGILQKVQLTQEPAEVNGEGHKESGDCEEKRQEQSVDGGNGTDKMKIESRPQVSMEGTESDSPEVPVKSESNDGSAKRKVSKAGAKGKKRRGDPRNGDHDGLPTKKRRSFGRPAVLSKVRTRPFSPEDKEASKSIDPKGPVTGSVDAPREETNLTVADKEQLEEAAQVGATKANDVYEAGTVVRNVTAEEATRGTAKHSSKALLLFEEVETQFEEDKGFMSAVSTLATSTKRPMIVTCNELAEVVPACDFRKLTLEFGPPLTLELTVHTCLVAAAEGFPVNPWVVERLVKLSKGDIRRVLLQVQLWSQPGLSNSQIEEPLRDALKLPISAGQGSAVAKIAVGQQAGESSPPEMQEHFMLPNETSRAKSAVEAPANLSQAALELLTIEKQIATQQSTGAQELEAQDHSKVKTSRQSNQISTLWLSDAVQELQLHAAHRSLPALADVALPCQLATAVAAHQNRRILRQERLAEIAAGQAAARVYGGLEEEAVCAGRIRKALQEAKAAARAAGKAELAEKRRLAREARRAAKRAAEENGDDKTDALVEDLELEDIPIGSPVRKRLRGRRVALSEDDVSEGPADVSRPIFEAGDESTKQIEPEDQMQDADALHADQACAVCGETDAEESMLLCDGEGCQRAIHTFCSQPSMESIPEGDWFCVKCSDMQKADDRDELQLERKGGGRQEEGNEMNGQDEKSSKADVSWSGEERPLYAPQRESSSLEETQQESLSLKKGVALGKDMELQQLVDGSLRIEEQLVGGKSIFDDGRLTPGGEDEPDRSTDGKEQGVDFSGLQQQAELHLENDCGLPEDPRDLRAGVDEVVEELLKETEPEIEDSLPEELEDLRVEDMGKLISRESCQAVPISAALWKLTDDLSATELMSGGAHLAGDSAPSLDQDVSKQAAACLAYASLRCRLESLSAATLSSIEASENGSEDAKPPSIVQVSTGDVTNDQTRARDVRASEGVRQAERSAGELERAGQLLAAAGDDEALCRFLAAGKKQPDLRWLQLKMDAQAEQKEAERTAVTQSLRELSVEVTSSRSCAWLRTGLASVEYASFLGQMSNMIDQRESQDEGWLRSERGASQAYVPAWDVPDCLLRTIKQSLMCGPRG